ncbi:MAG: glycosyltransferase family 9 protein [Planctomycetota bacterium]|nr:glycosyltransferase family 9 protein [Planctomycetota bacterium]
MTDPRSILIIRPSALGDVCRSVPVLVSLKRAFPNARIDWLVQDGFAAAIADHPDLGRIVPFARRELGAASRRGNFGPVRRFFAQLREANYDLVIDCQGLLRSGLFAWATRAKRRVGFANARELGWLGVNERHDVSTSLHSVDRMLELLRRAGVPIVHDMRLYSNPQACHDVAPALQAAGSRYAVVAPTSRWAAKRWPADRFARVVENLCEHGYSGVVIVGGANERDQCGPLLEVASKNAKVIDRIGGTSVAQLMAIIESASLVIANDSAALHMAVGFDRPTVALYGPTRVELVGPYRRERDVIQHLKPGDSFDHKNDANVTMMQRISVDEVIERVAAISRDAAQTRA